MFLKKIKIIGSNRNLNHQIVIILVFFLVPLDSPLDSSIRSNHESKMLKDALHLSGGAQQKEEIQGKPEGVPGKDALLTENYNPRIAEISASNSAECLFEDNESDRGGSGFLPLAMDC
jgi:hypothetical protein